jgi:hypothetical protein
MFNKGDKVSVLDEAINGVVYLVKEQSNRRNRGWIYDDIFVKELKINDSSNLLDSIRRINVDEIAKEKEIPKPRKFCQRKKSKHEIAAPV